MVKENTEINNNVLTKKDAKIFKSRNKVKIICATTGVAVGMGGGIGVGYGIYHNQQSSPSPTPEPVNNFLQAELEDNINNITFITKTDSSYIAIYSGLISSLEGTHQLEIDGYDWLYDTNTGEYSENAYRAGYAVAYELNCENDKSFHPIICSDFSLNSVTNLFITMREPIYIKYLNPNNTPEEEKDFRWQLDQFDSLLSGGKGIIENKTTQILQIKNFSSFCDLFHRAWMNI